ncbi:MAG: glycosyltransferase family 2 protein [Candidatus Omnitrophota bacterium]|jgi:GT2 family glycosyltransferase|nr:MAG: glycosyltransferase family 2 protein [Candidatus Omnitrophota bacterium]
MPKVAVIVVNYNGAKFLKGLMSSIESQTITPSKLIFVDNGSSDNSLEVLKDYPHITILNNRANLGFSVANNQALGSISSDIDYVCLLNNDTRIERRCIQNMIFCAESNVRIGAVAPRILFYNPVLVLNTDKPAEKIEIKSIIIDGDEPYKIIQDKQVRSLGELKSLMTKIYVMPKRPAKTGSIVKIALASGNKPVGTLLLNGNKAVKLEYKLKITEASFVLDERSILNQRFIINNAGTDISPAGYPLEYGFGEEDSGKYDMARHVNAFCGAAVLIKRKLFSDKIFDERFFAYYEDIDLSIRIRKSGYNIMYCPEAVAYHYHTGSSLTKKDALSLFNKSRIKFLFKHYPFWFSYMESLKYGVKAFVCRS